jgi:hypothetical protein
MGAFVWRRDGSDAIHVAEGASDVNGTDHDVPSGKDCSSCHGGEPGRLLGVSALQLPQLSGTSTRGIALADLTSAGLLSVPPPASAAPFAPPGAPEVARALGYLHANCGHCHDRKGLAYRDTDLLLRLSIDDRDVLATGAYRSAIGIKMQKTRVTAATLRIAAGDPAASGVVGRMTSRNRMEQMPPIATEHVDRAGVEMVAAWIRALPVQ